VTAPDAGAVTALVPCHIEPPARELVERLAALVGEVVVVDDGMERPAAARLDAIAAHCRAEIVRLARNRGKGHAVAAGIDRVLGRRGPHTAALVVDADGQHPADRIPAFLEAAGRAELVIGDRFGQLARMPLERRLANLAASRLVAARTGCRVRDSQCGMRLLHGRALSEVPFPPGGYEAETRHLIRCLLLGVRVAWVPIPAIYAGAPTSFRPLRDSLRVVSALGR
jgi:glycosyltransferase involved in cell wall biosynthesis